MKGLHIIHKVRMQRHVLACDEVSCMMRTHMRTHDVPTLAVTIHLSRPIPAPLLKLGALSRPFGLPHSLHPHVRVRPGSELHAALEYASQNVSIFGG
jgi:hypothetical protein